MPTMDAIQLFAKNFVGITYEDLPQDVVEITKKEVLDFLGVALEKALKKVGIENFHFHDPRHTFVDLFKTGLIFTRSRNFSDTKPFR
jgi:integrase